MDYKEVIKERIKGLPETLRVFVLDEKWRRDAEQIGKQFNLNEEKYTALENEIFMVLLCFEPQKDFRENIKNELQIDTNTVGWITEDVKKNIFSKISQIGIFYAFINSQNDFFLFGDSITNFH